MRRLALAVALLATAASTPAQAAAIVVGRGDTPVVQRATTVVVLREGRRTVLTIRTTHDGPDDVVLVVPLPVKIDRADVNLLPHEILDRLGRAVAPRLIELWEQPPCDGIHSRHPEPSDPRHDPRNPRIRDADYPRFRFQNQALAFELLGNRASRDPIAWLHAYGYRVPPHVEAALRPHIDAGMFFLFAHAAGRRDASGSVTLPPLRIAYTDDTFTIPLVVADPHDLVVHVITDTRVEAADRPNLAIPTDLTLTPAARDAFPAFYAALLDHTRAAHPGAAILEHTAQPPEDCHACRLEALEFIELWQLGGSVLWAPPRAPSIPREPDTLPTGALVVPDALPTRAPVVPDDDPFQPTEQRVLRRRAGQPGPPIDRHRRLDPKDLVLTRLRLHLEPGAAHLTLRPASPIRPDTDHTDPRSHQPELAYRNEYSADYYLRHPWTGPIACAVPFRDVWGGPPKGTEAPLRIAADLPHAPQGSPLTTYLTTPPPAASQIPAGPPPLVSTRCSVADDAHLPPLVVLLLSRRRRRATHAAASPTTLSRRSSSS